MWLAKHDKSIGTCFRRNEIFRFQMISALRQSDVSEWIRVNGIHSFTVNRYRTLSVYLTLKRKSRICIVKRENGEYRIGYIYLEYKVHSKCELRNDIKLNFLTFLVSIKDEPCSHQNQLHELPDIFYQQITYLFIGCNSIQLCSILAIRWYDSIVNYIVNKYARVRSNLLLPLLSC